MRDPRLKAVADLLARSGTWFSVGATELAEEYGGEAVMADTRRHGSVGEGTYGREDLAEARRLSALVRAAFPDLNVSLEPVDEWVTLTIDGGPRRYSVAALQRLDEEMGYGGFRQLVKQLIGRDPGAPLPSGGTYDQLRVSVTAPDGRNFEVALWGNSPAGLAVSADSWARPEGNWEAARPTRADISHALDIVLRKAGLRR